MLSIVTLDHWIAAPQVVNATLESGHTLLDADIVIIDPSELSRLWSHVPADSDHRVRVSVRDGVQRIRAIFSRRRGELTCLLKNGRVVVAFMSRVDAALAEVPGERQYEIITNYDWLPGYARQVVERVKSGRGSPVLLKARSHVFAPYYGAFKDELAYEAYIDAEVDASPRPLASDRRGRDAFARGSPQTYFLVNKAQKPVGCYLEVYAGLLVLVPPPPADVDSKTLVGVLLQCVRSHFKRGMRTREPQWAKGHELPRESEFLKEIDTLSAKIDQLDEQREGLKREVQSLADLRALLYEQGKPLEEAVLQAFQLMGFAARRVEAGDMEHDAVLEAAEGRAICEVEGRNEDAIHVHKLDQLTRVVEEDFRAHDAPAHGILIGNAYRLKPPGERDDCFTEKTREAAEWKGFALLNSTELFRAVVTILESPDIEDLKAVCRRVLLGTKGREVIFPLRGD